VAVEDARSGVQVSEVMDGGPAARAGLLVGDVIRRVNQARVQRALALRWAVATSGAGHWVRLKIRRGDQPLTMRVRLEDIPAREETEPMEGKAPAPPPVARPAGNR
jgi:serine protease Do